MKNIAFLILTFAVCVAGVSCKKLKSDRFEKKVSKASTNVEKDTSNILIYKVKEENFHKDSLGLIFTKIYLKEVAENEYDLKIEAEPKSESSSSEFHKNYYLILCIYPFDEDKELMEKERVKYGFEMFSVKIKKDKADKLLISRRIKTKVNSARAITLSVMEYVTKQKSKEIVLQNVKF